MEEKHPSFDIIGSKGSLLAQKRIVLCVTGSVAAVRAPEIARELMRRGAHVFPVMTESACRIIHPDCMHWATGHKPVIQLTGAIEHIALAGNVDTCADLVLVAPATANTISKIACAIDDTSVTSVVTTALGQGIPLVIAPAMHESMYNHPLLKENIEKLTNIGVTFLLPVHEEGKAKIMDTESLVRAVCGRLTQKKSLDKKEVLITSGRTVEYIDPVRVITNNSTGKMGRALAQSALAKGARVTVITGKAAVSYPSAARIKTVNTAQQMQEAVAEELTKMRYDLCIAAAAVGDWKPKKTAPRKISTHAQPELILELEATPKIVDNVKRLSPATFVVAFRAVHNLEKQELINDALARLKKAQADLIVVNDVSGQGAGFEADTNEITVIGTDKQAVHLQKQDKEQIAAQLLEIIAEKMRKASKV
ncbi:MAG: bifunctional phosphopantothenoylcysteine decarboxylase/phosphopantothenate--cysteine ligase CoaBC [Spirochaetales bacterium]|nr:bifunctional phosphopantothenoylcysteine decarboxylase/phosphopantothenate--cysteine ligase CoaBC [Spirochaetales bacterium]